MDLSLFKPIENQAFKEDFVLLLEEMILTDLLQPGDRLPAERELAEHYGVSRPSIHDCILILENRGLLTLRPRHGIIINDYRREATLEVLLSLLRGSGHEPGPELHTELEHFRIHMEKDIIRLICSRGSNASMDIDQLERINDEMAAAEEASRLAELDFQFHLQLAIAGGNSIYPLLSNTLKPAHTKYLTRFYETQDIRDIAVNFHRELISALRDGDQTAALQKIRELDSYSAYK
ncbi:MAG: FCD domain-containing protein [Spirochaetales bacterium]|uniref:FCD domain-containing protein n=1 Tax=Candidatus Thalassospirochaeta sargassi TaxID=3119039 RepID=A0AAJ1MNQ1_9SPIO|nr:FCD domain-containing protein [Spirochaetales bacterium]